MNNEQPLIEIDRDDKNVKIVFHQGPLESTYGFYFSCGDVHYAQLLRDHFIDKLKNMVREIRQEEYLKGYKHGRWKQAKKTWFSCWLKRGLA
jgi:hypothetical protein